MKITVWMDEGGEIWAHHEQGDRREVCFFKTEEETDEELRAWGYPLLVDAYPAARLEAVRQLTGGYSSVLAPNISPLRPVR